MSGPVSCVLIIPDVFLTVFIPDEVYGVFHLVALSYGKASDDTSQSEEGSQDPEVTQHDMNTTLLH